MARIAIINPQFEVSYWGMEYVMPIAGKKANMPVSSLPLLAALTPREHDVVLVDENVETLDYELLDSMDIIGITGMSVQRFRMREIMAELKRRGKFVAVGGAWATVREGYFADLADVTFVGEADETWPAFLLDWARGAWKPHYEQSGKTDLSKLPPPRLDLLKMDRYLFGTMQISRGCPFLCDFCDIIQTFGRIPRYKTTTQVAAELDGLRARAMRQVFIVDDNFIANKALAKDALRGIIAYQEEHGYPFRLFTEASLDLADDEEMMSLMVEANINAVFVGLESPSEAALKETRKNQNIKPKAGTMLERVAKLQAAGIEVWCGMIVGFDSDDKSIFDVQIDFIQASHIPHVMIGMLYAIPKTPLYQRLLKAGRLDTADVPEYGTNVIPAGMSREVLQQGYMQVMCALHEPGLYFDRLEALYVDGLLHRENLGRVKYWRRHPWQKIKLQTLNVIGGLLFFRQLMHHVDSAELRAEYRRRIWRVVKATLDPSVVFTYIGKCAMHYHYDRLWRDLESGRAINTL